MSEINLIVNGQKTGVQTIRELKPEYNVTQARQITDNNGLDEIYFNFAGKNYVAVSDYLHLDNSQGIVPRYALFDNQSQQIHVNIDGIDNEINSFAEGWASGKNILDSVIGGVQGFLNKPQWNTIDQMAQSATVTALPIAENNESVVSPPLYGTPTESETVTDPKIKIHFSQVYSGDIEAAKNHPDSPDKHLAKFIDSAHKTLDMALFELDSEIITDAILRAKERGVTVRLVTDDNYLEEESIHRLKAANIPIVDDNRSGLMHNKFVVVDGSSVWTGSMNTTNNGAWKNNNNALKIDDSKLAENYTQEFEEMFVRKQFGARSPDDTPNPILDIDGVKVQNYFASEGNVARIVEKELRDAKKSIHFMAFSFTEDGIGQAVLDRASDGVKVQGVFENVGSGSKYSEYGKMKAAGLDVKVDGNKYVMHHKVFIIDGEKVITGSYNFSDSADSKNDENILIIDDANIAKIYEEEFQKVAAQAVTK